MVAQSVVRVVSRNTAPAPPAPNMGLSTIYSCRYLTFSNFQQVWQFQMYQLLAAPFIWAFFIRFLGAAVDGTVGSLSIPVFHIAKCRFYLYIEQRLIFDAGMDGAAGAVFHDTIVSVTSRFSGKTKTWTLVKFKPLSFSVPNWRKWLCQYVQPFWHSTRLWWHTLCCASHCSYQFCRRV